MLWGFHENIVTIAAEEIGANLFLAVAQGNPITNHSPHLLGQGSARLPNILRLADRAAKGFGNLPDLNVNVRLVLHGSGQRKRKH